MIHQLRVTAMHKYYVCILYKNSLGEENSNE